MQTRDYICPFCGGEQKVSPEDTPYCRFCGHMHEEKGFQAPPAPRVQVQLTKPSEAETDMQYAQGSPQPVQDMQYAQANPQPVQNPQFAQGNPQPVQNPQFAQGSPQPMQNPQFAQGNPQVNMQYTQPQNPQFRTAPRNAPPAQFRAGAFQAEGFGRFENAEDQEAAKKTRKKWRLHSVAYAAVISLLVMIWYLIDENTRMDPDWMVGLWLLATPVVGGLIAGTRPDNAYYDVNMKPLIRWKWLLFLLLMPILFIGTIVTGAVGGAFLQELLESLGIL